MSAPALNASPSPVVTTTRTASSVRASSNAARYWRSSTPVKPLRSCGRLSRQTCTAPCRSTTSSLIAVPPAQRSSGNLPALTVDCSSTYSDRPSEPNSRPMPDCLNPPKGQLVSSVYMLMP
jgi:hypothetical protein